MNLILRDNNPFRVLNKTLEDLVRGSRWPKTFDDVAYPAIDIEENDKEVVLTAELPGVKREDIEINIDNKVLHLKGEKRLENSATEGSTYLE